MEDNKVGAQMKRIIGFLGKKGVGKNFVSSLTKEVMVGAGRTVVELAFADPIKEHLIEVLGIDRKLIYGDDKDKNSPTQYFWQTMPRWIRERMGKHSGPMTIRHVMQVYGTELGREIWGMNIWTDAIKRRIDTISSDYILIVDVRFQNEIDSIKSWDGMIIRIDGQQRGDESVRHDDHSSEKVMDSTVRHDYTIFNAPDDTARTLTLKMEAVLKGMYGSL